MCKILILASYGIVAVARKHAYPPDLHIVPEALQRPPLPQTALASSLYISVEESPIKCRNQSAWRTCRKLSCNASSGSQPVHSIASCCIGSAHCCGEGVFSLAIWPNEAVATAEADPGLPCGDQKQRALLRRPRQPMRRIRMTQSTLRVPMQMVQPPERLRRHARALCLRRVLRRPPRRLIRWRPDRWLPPRPSRCHLCQLRTHRLQLSWHPLLRQWQDHSGSHPGGHNKCSGSNFGHVLEASGVDFSAAFPRVPP